MREDYKTTYCYVFRTAGDLVHFFPCAADTTELPTLPDQVTCFVRQQDFYTALSKEDAGTFESFCRGKYSTARSVRSRSGQKPAPPSLLLFPYQQITAVFAERYTAQMLSHVDPLPGAVANALGQTPMYRLREQFPNHHLILSMLFSSLQDLYSTTSPLLASIPPLVQTLVAEIEKLQDPAPVTDTLPFLKSYHRELRTTDTPVFLDLARILPRLTAWVQCVPQFDGLYLRCPVDPEIYTPEMYQVRFPVSVFTHVFVLLSYLTALASDDSIGFLSLYRDGTNVCLTFQTECSLLSAGFSCRNELYSLMNLMPHRRGLLTLVQYLLHRNHIPFHCSVRSGDSRPTLELKLYLDTRFREEIEFRSGDVDAQLAETLPDALELLRWLTE